MALMQTKLFGRLTVVALVWWLASAAQGAHAQEAPVGQDDVPPAPRREVHLDDPSVTLEAAPRHPRRATRLIRTGGILVGLGFLGIIVGSGVSSSLREPCDEDSEFCYEPISDAAALMVMMAPVLLVGIIVAGRGGGLRGRERRLTAGVELTGGRYGLRLLGRF